MSERVLLSVVAPVYNEEDNIERVLRYWDEYLSKQEFDSEIIVTNDGSKDRTEAILERLSREIQRLRVFTFETNLGYGRALSNSISHSRGQYVVTLDSDGQFDLADLGALLRELKAKDLDMVTGYRRKKNDTLFRVLADRILNILVRVLFGLKLKDTNCALKLCKGEILRAFPIEALGYPTPTEILIKAGFLGAKIGEVEVAHLERKGGLSKLKPLKTGLDMIKFFIYLKYKLYLGKKRIINLGMSLR